jgi:hypothetical protein
MADIPNAFQQLAKARAKLVTAEENFKQSSQALKDDRHQWAGKIYEHQNTVNKLLDDLIDLVSQEESLTQ